MSNEVKVQFANDGSRSRKRVKYINSTGSDHVIYEGEPMCYVYDSTTNLTGWSRSANAESFTTDEGYQNEGKYLTVEDPSTSSLFWWAGVVASGGWCGKTVANGCSQMIEIYIPNGAIVPVRAKANCVVGVTPLGVGTGGQYMEPFTGDSNPLGCAIAMETTNLSSTEGLVLAKIFNTGQVVSGIGGTWAPYRPVATGDAAGIRVYLDNLFTSTGATGPRTYGLYITGDRDSDYVLTTAGCDDAAIRVSTTNYAANDEVYNFRGLNVRVANRGGGVVGELSNTITAFVDDDDSDGTKTATIKALALETYQESPDTPDEMGVLDVCVCREGGVATTEYGIQIRTRGTINTAVNSAIRLTKDATDHGYINLFNIEADAIDVLPASGDTAHDSGDICIPIVYDGSTYYIVAQDSRG